LTPLPPTATPAPPVRSRHFATLFAAALALCIGLPSLTRAQDAGVPAGAGTDEGADATGDAAGSPDEDEAGTEPEGEEYVEGEPRIAVPETLCQGRMIRRIRVAGTQRVSEDDILGTIRLRRGVPCTDAEVTRDARALWDLGYFDDIVVEAEPAGSAIDLVVTVHERPAIGKIRYEGNDAIENSDIEEKVTLREGAILSVPDVRENVTKIRDLYAEKGYFLARVDFRLRTLPSNEVEVVFTIREGAQVTVRNVRFVGNRSIPDSEISAVMQTSETGFFSFISSNNTFRKEFFEEDVNRLQALYYDRGFLSVQVGTPRIELTPDREHIDLTIPIEEGPRFRVGRVRIVELDADGVEVEPLGGRRQLREQINVQPGEWFSRTTIARDLLAVTRTYRDRGYAKVDIQPQTDLDAARRTVAIVIQIQRGPLVRIDRIQVRGNAKTRDLVIRREIVIVEGDLYNQTLVEASKARIQALGFFESVEVSEEEGSTPDSVVLNFEVAEKATGTFQVGAGFSSIESFIFTAQVQQNNLFGLGQSLTLQLQLSGIRQLVQVRLVEPYLWGTQWSAAVEAFRTIRQFQSFNRDSTGGSLTLGHAVFTDYLRLFVQYTAEYVDISERTGGGLGTGNQNINAGLRLPIANLFRSGLTSSVRLSLTWDSRDNRLFPTRGIFASLSSELADSVLGSQNTFLRHRLFFRWYYPVFGGVVLKMNTEAGLITSRQAAGVPVFERFFLGGILDVRGFPLRTLGPRTGLPLAVDPNASGGTYGEPFGGNVQFFYNLELEFPILESVGVRGVLFTDAGNAWNLEQNLCQAPGATFRDPQADPCTFDPFGLRFSTGFGIRWFSPLGPLRFEWGLPISPRVPFEAGSFPGRFEFTIGNFF
jgi:outer membrane protein insertion porin family